MSAIKIDKKISKYRVQKADDKSAEAAPTGSPAAPIRLPCRMRMRCCFALSRS